MRVDVTVTPRTWLADGPRAAPRQCEAPPAARAVDLTGTSRSRWTEVLRGGMLLIAATMALALALATPPVHAEPAITTKQVQFKKGESGATIKGAIKGEQIIDYKLRAGAGQSMVVQFKPSNPSAYFNVLPPGSSGEAIHIGSTAGNEFSTELKAGGEYTIRVYLMRNAARRNESVQYTLDIGISGDVKKSGVPAAATPTATLAPGGDNRWLLVDGNEFHHIPHALIHGG
jgi:hypothetical protein